MSSPSCRTPDPQPPEADDAATLQPDGHVQLNKVSFRYLPDRPLIEDLTLDVQPGQRIAIVGPTGCGKTTLITLLMRFYDVDSGSIRVSGQDIRQVTRSSLRGSYGKVLQDTWLRAGTIPENIAYGRPDATEADVMTAASLPPMLILDEATSSIDTRTVVRIKSAFARMMQGRTSFIVAHRLSTIRQADVILVRQDGHIVEQGSHEALLAKGGFYAALYNSQFEGVEE